MPYQPDGDTQTGALFGPVPSRRLGLSLGVDLVPFKTCTLDCVYCECGPTTHKTVRRAEYIATGAVIRELDQYLAENPAPDFVTFSGGGEPTLHTGLGDIARHVKAAHPGVNVALLTNGTLFADPAVRRDAGRADVVCASLDAATPGVFARVNRPHRSVDLSAMIEGLALFAADNPGRLWIEVFLVEKINDTDDEIRHLAKAVETIGPDRVVLNTLDRPGTEPWVAPVSAERLAQISPRLANAASLGPPTKRRSHRFAGPGVDQIILDTARRRPVTSQDLAAVTGLDEAVVHPHIEALLEKGAICAHKGARGVFYRAGDV